MVYLFSSRLRNKCSWLNNKKIDKDKHMQIEHFINQIDLTLDPPAEEPLRQYYFIAKARTLVAQMEKEAGRKMTFCVNTFGCQMNLK